MKLRTIVLVVVAACLAAAAQKRPSNIEALFVTDENLEIVRRPDRVDACVLRYIAPPKGGNRREERYEETEYLLVPSDLLAPMQEALLRDSNYGWDIAKACWPRYHARLRFHRGEKIVAIDFCFSCDILLIMRDGRPISGEDFQERIFIQSIRKMFPDDAALKKAR